MKPLGIILVALLLSGCATHADQLAMLRSQFYTGDLAGAASSIDEQLPKRKDDADVLLLERSIIELCDGRPSAAEQTLRQVRDRFDYLEQSSLAEEGLSMFTDDHRRAYHGEDYEKVFLRSLLALSNLLHDGTDAGAYGLQALDKQQQIIEGGSVESGENPKLAYKRVALGAYIHGLIREETHTNFDDASHANAMVVSWQPDFRYGQQDLERTRHGRHSAPGHGVVYVFGFVGRGPYKVEAIEAPTTVALLIADRILSAIGNQTLPPTIAPVKVPMVVRTRNRIQHLRVAVAGHPAGLTDTITDVGSLAEQQYAAIYPQIVARAVVRRIVKKGVIYAGKEMLDVHKGTPAGFLLDIAGVVWEATEAADTRCWGLLPDKIQVLRLELPAGRHRLTLEPGDLHGPCGVAEEVLVSIGDGRNTYVLANFPDSRLVGKVCVHGG